MQARANFNYNCNLFSKQQIFENKLMFKLDHVL